MNRAQLTDDMGTVATTPDQRRAARITVAANATDPSDAAHLLAVLGLDKEDQ